MALGISWGTASVMVLLAVANGFERSQKAALSAYGDRFLLLRLNRAELDRAAGGEERRLMMDALDIERLRAGAPAIRRLSPMNMAYRARVTAASGGSADVYISGSLPEIAEIRTIPLVEGRFHNETDESQRRRVMVLGPLVRRQLFGERPAVGELVRVAGFSSSAVPEPQVARAPELRGRRGAVTASFPGAVPASPARPPGAAPAGASSPSSPSPQAASSPSAPAPAAVAAPVTAGEDREDRASGELFEVIGVLADREVQRDSYVSVARLAFIPFSTSTTVFDDDYNIMLIEPRSLEEKEVAIGQFAEVMGARYGFETSDQNAVLVFFDAIEKARSIETIFRGLRVFLAAVGALILAIGAVGIMNVVLVSLASRRYEIGLRKALGATPGLIYAQLFLETAASCALSGLFGLVIGVGGIALLHVVPLPEGLSVPRFDLEAGLWALGLLALVAAAVASYPARRAARMPPVEALRSPA
jgi:ABC-type antimicrobial peptide transport system permease subunit